MRGSLAPLGRVLLLTKTIAITGAIYCACASLILVFIGGTLLAALPKIEDISAKQRRAAAPSCFITATAFLSLCLWSLASLVGHRRGEREARAAESSPEAQGLLLQQSTPPSRSRRSRRAASSIGEPSRLESSLSPSPASRRRAAADNSSDNKKS
eukprot:Polyplicarium_translucidae@DN3106_c0_g1_i1.p1